MRVLVIGSGGREHALVWKLAQSPLVTELFALPGNVGMQKMATLVDISIDDLHEMADFALDNKIDLTVVGPEVPLDAGIVDVFEQKGLKIFGPSKAAAKIESSKAFAKDLMAKYNIPTAFYKTFTDPDKAKAYIKEKGAPIVIKADGLAAGKGVVVAMTDIEALDAIDSMMCNNQFGSSGARVVIEEFLQGEELSVLAFSDGTTVLPMVAAQDHKRVYDGDQGPNTGGMGTYAPAPVATESICNESMQKVLKPIVAAMKKEGISYKGCLYAGLISTADGIKVIEFNARFGDPETQVILPLLQNDLVQVFLSCIDETLHQCTLNWSDRAAVCVVMASGGYPLDYEKNNVITGLDVADKLDDVMVFHAGTKKSADNIVTNGGRVLGVTAVGDSILAAQKLAYKAVELIDFKDAHYRGDIAFRAITRAK